MRQMTARFEKAAEIGSIACAIHCAVLPVVIGLGAAGAVSWLNETPVEWGLVLFSSAVGTISAWRGFRTHGNLAVAAILAIAAVGLLVLTWSHRAHPELSAGHDHSIEWLLPLTGVTLGATLFVNRRLCSTCDDCQEHDHTPEA